MYKLVKFDATNVIGFMSGLGKKHFVLDLKELKHKDILVVLGDNASGKSTFLSLVHPTHIPADGRTKFIIPGKEGYVIRTYEGDDGTIIVSKCIYTPKSDEGHSAKCYLAVKKPSDKEAIELNPTGNVTSYNALLYTYFGITKDYVNFASYSDAVAGMVSMTDTERKNSVASMVPNTGRFELAYSTVNDKYKELRNLIRNVSQKILALKDIDTLDDDLKRITKDLNHARKAHDEYLQILSKIEGQVDELSHGKNIDEMIEEYHKAMANVADYQSRMVKQSARIKEILDSMNINFDPNNLFQTLDMKMINEQVLKYDKRLSRTENAIQTAGSRSDKLNNELFQTEKDIMESESVLYSIQTQDVKELRATKTQYESQLAQLKYTKYKDRYEDMTYQECITFMKVVSTVSEMCRGLYDEYGDLVSHFFKNMNESTIQYDTDIQTLSASIETKTTRRDSLYRQLIEKEQYRKFQGILEQRPSNCKIDSCPFIATALKWSHIAGEIADLTEEYKKLGVEITEDQDKIDQCEKALELRQVAQNLIQIIEMNSELFQKYYKFSPVQIYLAIGNGTWDQLLDVMPIKEIAAILSEKDLYIRITEKLIPEIDHAIEIAKVYGTNREILINQLDRMKHTQKLLKSELSEIDMETIATHKMRKLYQKRLNIWRELKELAENYRAVTTVMVQTSETLSARESEIKKILNLVDQCAEIQKSLEAADKEVEELTPIRQQIIMDINTLTTLQEEKDQIEQDFMIVEIMKNILQPGKGLRKELLNIYFFDIYQTANQLLLNTFGGKLRLHEFIITDKEFTIPFEYSGEIGSDIAYASSSQRATVAIAISLAIISKLVDQYSIVSFDESDQTLSPANKAVFVDIISKQMKMIGISQAFVITHSPEYYANISNCGYIGFPGWDNGTTITDDDDVIEIK